MMKKEIYVNVLEGKEDRPIAKLVQICNDYKSKIYFETDENKRINGKSLMGMMTLALYQDEPINVEADGEDEEAAIAGIEKYLTLE